MLDHFYPVFTRNYQDGTTWTQQSLHYSMLSADQHLIGRSYLNLGMSHYMRGDYPACLLNYQKALDLFETVNDQSYIGRTCNEFSVYWRKQKQFDTGLEYLDRSLSVCSACHDTACVETSLNNRAVIYEMMGRYDLALTYYRKAEEVAASIHDSLGQAYTYMDAAQCHRLNGSLDSAEMLIDRSIEILTQLGNLQGVGLNLVNKAALLVEKNELNSAVSVYEECIRLAERIKYTDLLKTAHYQLGQTYAQQKNFEKSFVHIERSYFLRDSLLNEDKLKALSDMEVKYETEKIEKNLLAEQQEHVKTELQVATRTNWLIGLGGFSATALFLGLFLYQRTSRLAQAEKDRAVIAEREKSIQAVFDATEKERSRISRELHDGIGQQMSGLKLAWQNLAASSGNQLTGNEKNKLQTLSKILDETAAEVRTLSHQMMPKVLESFGLTPALEDMLEKALQHTPVKYQFETYNFNERLPQKTELALFRIAQELISNVIKHAAADFVSVQLFKNQNQLILIVEDNGKGMPETLTAEGHGLLNIKSRLSTIQGQVNFERGQNSGTTVTVRVVLEAGDLV